ncbi:SWI/SNF matrix-associated actin-dependent regulator of chromatin subfamily E member 1 [Fasciolopsis buskii]|uniref:SWI/SNF matrix-associated actin-dependent regulator of chromatin subfamily E member 1 n=1 Tax=Fasciolopsis buskii TaxID=27845 RepID=A0A8E0S4I6_9TREM|nr:SWI/SNF matrix-associated actin-dependent regulator of chromatin subfamily E member 1 [Fasciolopsis buski]
MSTKSDTRIPKPPKAPEKPLMPYMRYSRKVWEQVKNSNPHLKLWEVGKIIGQMWRELPDDEKALYVEEYDVEKAQYTEALRQYHSSPAYQAWLVAKERAEKTMEEQDQERKQTMARMRDRSGDVPQSDLRESYILEDNEEDTEDQYTVKHVAAARFQRNHRLMQEILSDCRLPDPGQLITQSRLNTLRLQVEQLRNHKRNLCQEIDGCEARHRSKIQKIREDSQNFTSRPVYHFVNTIFWFTLQDMKGEPGSHGIPKPIPPSHSPRPSASLSETTVPSTVNASYQAAVSGPYPQAGVSPVPHRFPQSGHTQHHYPPPPSYPPAAMSPVTQPVAVPAQRGPAPLPQQVASIPGGLPKASPLTQAKKLSSSGSSTSSASSASSTSSKKKRSDAGPSARDKKSLGDGNNLPLSGVTIERRSTVTVETTPDQARSGEITVPGSEYIQPSMPSGMSRHPAPAYPQPPPSSVSGIPCHPMPTGPPQTPFGYEHSVSAGSGMPPAGYYHHPGAMTQSTGHPPGYPPHLRPPFGQHGGYPGHQYVPQAQHSGDHPPPPPPMYVQHMSQQPHLQPPGGSMLGGPGQHPPTQPHQGPVIGWQQAGGPSGYPPQYAPSRYPGPGGLVGYPPHARHAPGGYVIPPHGTAPLPAAQHPHQQGGPVPSSIPDSSVSNQPPIPAPPPYQQQQQQQQQQPNVPQPYWSGPHHIPPEYGGSGQPPSHQYISAPHSDGAPASHPSTSGENMGPVHSHSEAVAGHVNPQQHQTGMYYPGKWVLLHSVKY